MRTKGLSLALMHGRKGYYPAGLEEKMNDPNKDVRKAAQTLAAKMDLEADGQVFGYLCRAVKKNNPALYKKIRECDSIYDPNDAKKAPGLV